MPAVFQLQEEARDVLQESYIKIFTYLRTLQWRGFFEGWMRRIVVNTALEKHRNRYYLNKVEDFESVAEPSDSSADADLSGLEAEDLLEFVMDLPPNTGWSLTFMLSRGIPQGDIRPDGNFGRNIQIQPVACTTDTSEEG
ncbi:MAG: hypothetical protein R2727_02900 [Bacteroidales bacterium]